jgi:hypothetical protein
MHEHHREQGVSSEKSRSGAFRVQMQEAAPTITLSARSLEEVQADGAASHWRSRCRIL